MKICTLSEDINNCPFYDKEKRECNNTLHSCGFVRDDFGERNVSQKEEKWFEKYHKDSRPKKS